MDSWYSLWCAELCSPQELGRWMETFDTPEDALEAALLTPGRSRALSDLGSVAAAREHICRERARADAAMTVFDVGWRPLKVRESQLRGALRRLGPFAVVAGNPGITAHGGLGVVGTRKLTRPLATRLETLLRKWLEPLQTGVISGGAYGCDAIAHDTALRYGLATTIVLAGGAAHVGPRPHRRAFRRVVEAGGCLITIRPPHRRPYHGDFLKRNRWIATVSDVVLVLAAPTRSGAMSTARAARDAGRTVLAVPGEPADPSFEGCLELLRQGAGVAANPRDVREALAVCSSRFQQLGLPAVQHREPRTVDLDDPVLGELVAGPRTADELAGVVGPQAAANLASRLLELELSGEVYRDLVGRYRLL